MDDGERSGGDMKEVRLDKTDDYEQILLQLDALMEEEAGTLANLSNTAALLWMALPGINWAGFYILRGDVLTLGPFQGKPACTRIPVGKGVCGTAAASGKTIVVPNVHAFSGHIACDADSRAEIVIPLFVKGALWGLLDIDSPVPGRFAERDRAGLEKLAACIVRHISAHDMV
jgi:L-methionine (R)-S-oxide reductase